MHHFPVATVSVPIDLVGDSARANFTGKQGTSVARQFKESCECNDDTCSSEMQNDKLQIEGTSSQSTSIKNRLTKNHGYHV